MTRALSPLQIFLKILGRRNYAAAHAETFVVEFARFFIAADT
jgi:hypothetical protein